MIKLYDIGIGTEPTLVKNASGPSLETSREILARLDLNTIRNLLLLVEHPDTSDPDTRLVA